MYFNSIDDIHCSSKSIGLHQHHHKYCITLMYGRLLRSPLFSLKMVAHVQVFLPAGLSSLTCTYMDGYFTVSLTELLCWLPAVC